MVLPFRFLTSKDCGVRWGPMRFCSPSLSELGTSGGKSSSSGSDTMSTGEEVWEKWGMGSWQEEEEKELGPGSTGERRGGTEGGVEGEWRE